MRIQFKPLILAIIFINVLLFVGLKQDRFSSKSPMIGKTIAEFSLPNLSPGKPNLTEADFYKQPALINFFATWCSSCKKEHETLLWIQQQDLLPIYGIVFKDSDINVTNFLQHQGNPYYMIAKDNNGNFAIDMGVKGFPQTYLIDSEGKIIASHVGTLSEKIFNKKFKPLLLKQ